MKLVRRKLLPPRAKTLQGTRSIKMADSMEYSLTDASIKERADKLEAPAEPIAEEKPEVKEEVKPEVKEDPKPVDKNAPKADIKPEIKKDEKHVPNDPSEFQKFVTRTGQELADLKRQIENERKEKQELREMFEKAAKKPIDWNAVSKDPAKAQALWEEHEAEVKQQYEEKLFVKDVESISKDMSRDVENYPDFKFLSPLMIKLTNDNGAEALKHDPNFNFNRGQKEVLHDLYKLAEKISPKVEAPKPEGKVMTEADIEKIKEEARQEALKAATTKEAKQAAGASVTGQFGGKGRKTPTSTADEVRNAPTLDEARKALKRSQGK